MVFKILITIALFFISLNGANVGDQIPNKAFISYQIDNIDKNITTNEVILKVAKTPATIEFLAIDPNGSNEILNPTYYEKNGEKINMPPAKLPDGTTINIPSVVKVKKAVKYSSQDLVIVRVKDLDQNKNAHAKDIIKIDVINERTKEKETLYLIETSNNSGIFVGYLFTKSCPNKRSNSIREIFDTQDGALCCLENDKIVAQYIDNGTREIVETQAFIPAPIDAFIVTKEQSKDKASIGSFIKYTITVENITKESFKDVKLIDELPIGVRYIKDSFRVDGNKATPNISEDGSTLTYTYPFLKSNQKVTYSYIVLIGAGVNKELINRAYAQAIGAKTSNIATTKLELKDELYRNKAYIIGRVYIKDCNSSCGVENVKLYMEDGRYSITDKMGRYHFIDISKGSHVIQIDKESIKNYKVVSCSQKGKYSKGDISSFVDIGISGIKRVDFCLKRVKNITTLKEQYFSINLKLLNKNRVRVDFKVNSNESIKNKEIYLKIPKGMRYIPNSLIEVERDKNLLIIPIKNNISIDFVIEKDTPIVKEIEAVLFYDKGKKRDLFTTPIVVALKSIKKEIEIVKESSKIALDESSKEKLAQNQIKKDMPKYTKEDVDNLGTKPKIVWPPKNWVPTMPSIRVAILYPKGGSVELYLNNQKVDPIHFEGIFRDSRGKMQIAHFKGIDLYEGLNRFKVIVKKDKKVIATLKRDIFLESSAPQKFELIKERSHLIADGKSEIIIAIKMIGKSGHPLRGGLVGSFETDKDHSPAMIVNGKGRFVVEENGIAYIKIKPTTKAEGLKLKFSNKTLDIKLKMVPRDWIVVGMANGTIGYKKISGNLKNLSQKGIKKGFYTDKKIVFFAQGRVLKNWLLTIAYNNKKEQRELFDKLDKDKYYPIYLDNSIQGNDAATIKRLYVRLEKNNFYAMFGDFKTEINGGEFTSYNKNLNGFKSQYRGEKIKATIFASKQNNIHYYEEIRLDGTTGYYYLKSKNIIPNSQKVSIITRDKDRKDIILDSEILIDQKDYVIDYDEGRIYLKKTIFSVDKNFNPRYLAIEYDVKEGDKKYYEFGGRVEYKDKNITIGATAIKKDTPQGGEYLVGIDGKFQLNKNLTIKGEYAKSKSILNSNPTFGSASKVEINYKDQNKSIKIYYRKQDNNFGLGTVSPTLGGTKIFGIDSSININKRLKLATQIYKTISYQQDKSSTSNLVVHPTIEYKEENRTISAGFKYSKESGQKADKRLTLSYFQKINKNLDIDIYHEQSFSNTFARTIVGFNYKVDNNGTFFAQIQRLKDKETRYSTIMGLEYKPWRDGKIKLYHQYSSRKDIFKSISFSQKFKINKEIELIAGIEKDFGSKESSTTYKLEGRYKSKKVSFSSIIEYKNSDEDIFNIYSDLVIKKNKNLALNFGLNYRYRKEENRKSRYIDAKLALAYRINSKFILLDRLDFIDDYTNDKNGIEESKKFVNNLHLNYIFNNNLEIGLFYGLKYEKDTIDKKIYSSWSDMLAINALYNIDQNWAIGAQVSILHSYTLNNFEYGAGLFIQRDIGDNFRIRLGYNFSGFNDNDFRSANYRHQGVYLNFEIKFNQDDIKKIFR